MGRSDLAETKTDINIDKKGLMADISIRHSLPVRRFIGRVTSYTVSCGKWFVKSFKCFWEKNIFPILHPFLNFFLFIVHWKTHNTTQISLNKRDVCEPSLLCDNIHLFSAWFVTSIFLIQDIGSSIILYTLNIYLFYNFNCTKSVLTTYLRRRLVIWFEFLFKKHIFKSKLNSIKNQWKVLYFENQS